MKEKPVNMKDCNKLGCVSMLTRRLKEHKAKYSKPGEPHECVDRCNKQLQQIHVDQHNLLKE